LLVVVGGLLVSVRPPIDKAEAGRGAGLANSVTGFPETGQGLLVVVGGLLIEGLPPVDGAKVGRRASFAEPVADLPGEGQGRWWWSAA